jgi:glycosyltransferase involved in cell wall biosynthesis
MLAIHRRLGTWRREIDAYVALSKFSRNKFVSHGLPAGRIYIKPNFPKRPAEYSILDEGYVLFLGRLSVEKGLWTLLKAWENLKHVKLKIAGDGPLCDKLQTKARERLLKNIEFLGYQSDSQCGRLLKSAVFVVLPSECYEGFPLIVAEAFAAGKPLIAANFGAMAEMVTDGRTGLHFAAGDHNELAAKVEWAWSHPQAMKAMGLAARKEYEDQYSAEINYAVLMDIYRRVTARKSDGL